MPEPRMTEAYLDFNSHVPLVALSYPLYNIPQSQPPDLKAVVSVEFWLRSFQGYQVELFRITFPPFFFFFCELSCLWQTFHYPALSFR
jgi:hypothetical protein